MLKKLLVVAALAGCTTSADTLRDMNDVGVCSFYGRAAHEVAKTGVVTFDYEAATAELKVRQMLSPDVEAISTKPEEFQKITIGMTKCGLIARLGAAYEIKTTMTKNGKHEEWIYRTSRSTDTRVFIFEDNRLVSFYNP